MPIRLAQVRLIPQDSYTPTHLRKGVPAQASSYNPGGTSHRSALQMAGAGRLIRKKILESPTEAEGNLALAGSYPRAQPATCLNRIGMGATWGSIECGSLI